MIALVTIRNARDIVGRVVGPGPLAGYVAILPLGWPRWATVSVPARDVELLQPELFG